MITLILQDEEGQEIVRKYDDKYFTDGDVGDIGVNLVDQFRTLTNKDVKF